MSNTNIGIKSLKMMGRLDYWIDKNIDHLYNVSQAHGGSKTNSLSFNKSKTCFLTQDEIKKMELRKSLKDKVSALIIDARSTKK